MGLTEDQRNAAHTPSSVAVTAGAGTGKTFMLAARYLFHLQEQHLSPLEVVAITFTERAANELRSRIRHTVITEFPDHPEREEIIAELEAAQISTIHSLCARICRDHPDESGSPINFEVLDDAEGASAAAKWFDQALDSMPQHIFDLISFSLLRAVLSDLLKDPITAERALTFEPEHWQQLAEEARMQVFSDLKADPDLIADLSVLRSFRGKDDDLKEQARRTVVEAAIRLEQESEEWVPALEAMTNIGLRGGSEKKWPDGGLAEVRDSLKRIRDVAKDYLKQAKSLEYGEMDRRFAEMLPALRQAFSHVRDFMRLEKHRAGQLDFADLEECALRALEHESVRRYYSKRWRAFLVDEFQDTNPIQAEILSHLKGTACLTIVGDEKQSIYGFRRADVEVFQRFKSEIEDDGGIHTRLSLSFRTHFELMGSFNRIFESVLDKLHSPLESHRQESPHTGPHLKVFAVTTDEKINKYGLQRTEARYMAGIIKQMLDDGVKVHDKHTGGLRPLRPGDFAILSRVWQPLDIYLEALMSSGVPAVHMGGGSLFETREAKDAISLIRFLAEPDDDLALIAVLRSPFFAVSDRVLFKASQALIDQKSWWEHVQTSNHPTLVRPITVLKELVDQSRTLSPSRLLQLADRLTGYSAVIANLVNAERREADWRGMMELVRSLEQRCGEGIFALSRRLKHLIQAMVEMPRPPLEAHNAVSLMTIHSAKGLEWPVVIVPDLSRRRRSDSRITLFDASRGVAVKLMDQEGQAAKTVLYSILEQEHKKRENEESRRLIYVALTRARDRVILSSAEPAGGYLDILLDGLEAADIPVEKIDFDPADLLSFQLPEMEKPKPASRMLI